MDSKVRKVPDRVMYTFRWCFFVFAMDLGFFRALKGLSKHSGVFLAVFALDLGFFRALKGLCKHSGVFLAVFALD
jgi:hypothetical protein